MFWPARRLSAPNLGLVRMNSVSEEQEEEKEEGEGEVMEAGRDVETSTIQAGRGIEKRATKKEFSGPLRLAVG